MGTTELTIDNFESHVKDDDILLVDFWADWCGPCHQFAPTYEAASEANPDITFGSINTEEQQELASAAGIQSIPTLMAFRDGILVFAQPGALPPPALDQVIEGVRGLDMDDVRRQIAEQEQADGHQRVDGHAHAHEPAQARRPTEG
jgi:thioredoxin 1